MFLFIAILSSTQSAIPSKIGRFDYDRHSLNLGLRSKFARPVYPPNPTWIDQIQLCINSVIDLTEFDLSLSGKNTNQYRF